MPYEGATHTHHESTDRTAQVLWDWYLQLITDVFPHAVTVDQLIDTANSFFTQYQSSNKQRLAPESLEKGCVDCTAAAALCGMFWWLTRGIDPIFFMENELGDTVHRSGKYDTSSLLAHSLVALPSRPGLTAREVGDAYDNLGNGQRHPDVKFVEYRHTLAVNKPIFRVVQPHRNIPTAAMFTRMDDFLKTQARRFKVRTNKEPLTVEREEYELMYGSLPQSRHLTEKVRAAFGMGLAVEGDYRDVEELHVKKGLDGEFTVANVRTAVVREVASGKPITVFQYTDR